MCSTLSRGGRPSGGRRGRWGRGWVWGRGWGGVPSGGVDRAMVAVGRGVSLGGGLLSIVIFVIKAPWALFPSAAAMCIWLVGLVYTIIKTAAKKKGDPDKAAVGFLGGVAYMEGNKGSGQCGATTLGCGVNAGDQAVAAV